MDSTVDAPVIFQAAYDEEAGVWYIASSSYPGLHTESPTLDRLLIRAREALASLREVNGGTPTTIEMRVAA